MATIKAVSENDSMAFSRSWREYFFCCFMRTSQSGDGANPLSTPGPSGACSVDYGSRRSECVQVISRSAADDDDYADDDEPQAVAYKERRQTEEVRRQNSQADCTTSGRRLPIETKQPSKNRGLNMKEGHQSISNSASCTQVKLMTTTTEGQTVATDINNCRPLVKSEQETHGETPNHVTNDQDSWNSTLDRGGGGAGERRKGAEKRGIEEEHQTSVLSSEVSAVDEDNASSSRCHAWLDIKRGVSEQITSDSHLFDVSDLPIDRSSSLFAASCGSIRLTLAYTEARELMNVTVHEAHDIPSHERGGASQTQIRMLLLPAKGIRQKTKVKPGENPEFNEAFEFKVPRENLRDMGLRVRLYGCERFRRDCLIGETLLAFSSVNTVDSSPQTTWIILKPRSSISHCDSLSDVSSLAPSESGSSNQSLHHGGTPELMIGLAYNAVTGRLSAEVIKGSNFRNMATKKRLRDTYVKLTLTAPNEQEITHSKTSVRRSQPNPLFKEMFVFQVAQFQLPDVSLLVSVFGQHSLKRKEMIGWFSLGNTSRSEEGKGHWSAMLDSKGEQVCRWHALLEP